MTNAAPDAPSSDARRSGSGASSASDLPSAAPLPTSSMESVFGFLDAAKMNGSTGLGSSGGSAFPMSTPVASAPAPPAAPSVPDTSSPVDPEMTGSIDSLAGSVDIADATPKVAAKHLVGPRPPGLDTADQPDAAGYGPSAADLGGCGFGFSAALQTAANKCIAQSVSVVDNDVQKFDEIRKILVKLFRGDSTLIFCSTQDACLRLSRHVHRQSRVPCAVVHEGLSQRERDRALQMFKTGRMPILVSTDLGAQSLDIKNITSVINFDPAPSTTEYVRRIGSHAARDVHTFLTRDPVGIQRGRGIAQVLTSGSQPVPPSLRALIGDGGREEPEARGHMWVRAAGKLAASRVA